MYFKPLFVLAFSLVILPVFAQGTINVYPKNSYVKDNLDVNAISIMYEQFTDLTDFERKLNSPEDQISNLDLNEDGHVDYLRVSEKIENNIKIIIIQSELSRNVYEDVATINIVLKSRDRNSNTDSGIRAKDIVLPFISLFLDVLLSAK